MGVYLRHEAYRWYLGLAGMWHHPGDQCWDAAVVEAQQVLGWELPEEGESPGLHL